MDGQNPIEREMEEAIVDRETAAEAPNVEATLRIPKLSDEEVIENACEFLKASSEYYKPMVDRKDRDMDMFSGNFWDDDTLKQWHRVKRSHENFNLWRVFSNAIVSPFSASSWHTELEDKSTKEFEDIQESINKFETDNDNKCTSLSCLHTATVGGVGAMVFSIIDKSEGDQELKLEAVEDITQVAFDPSITTTSGRDAEEGAIINYMSLRKAKRIFGEDIVGLDYPHTAPQICVCAPQWPVKLNAIQVVNYYYKEDDGKVAFAQICGNKVVKHIVLPIDIIPIIRMTGYKVKDVSRKIDYIGIVRASYSVQLGANLGYSTLLDRLNRSPKANFLMPYDAIDGLEDYYAKAGTGEDLLYLYKGNVVPTLIKESYETTDVMNTVNSSLNLMSNILGIPITGVNGFPTEKTATEVLVQNENTISNVACFYQSAYEAMKTVGTILTELLNDGEPLSFSLQKGPDVITRNAKKRQELSIIANLLPDNMKGIAAKYLADTMDDAYAKSLSDEIVANLDPSLKLVHQGEDPNAIRLMDKQNQMLNQALDQLEAAKKANEDLQKQVDSLQMAMLSNKQNQLIEIQKINNDKEIKMAELGIKSTKVANDKAIAEGKQAIDAEKAIMDAQKAKADIAAKYGAY